MIWKSLLLKFCFLGCAVAFVVTLNLQGDPGQQDDQILEAAVLPSDLHIEPLHPRVTTVGLYPSDNRPRAVNHHNQSIQPSLSSVSMELHAADGIDVNQAGRDALTQLPGIGVTLGRNVSSTFEMHMGHLTTLMRIKGIGQKRFAQIHSRLYISAR
ncbi:MAG TPA: hypothetical protein EYN18_08545 [Nitrospirales bacterium]|nr:hypothetical protein [Nitrospirales bacterium]HIO22425.1 hypothetical protein [Nitrospirales bacterium]